MSKPFYIQNGVISTVKKKTLVSQLFDVKKWTTDLLVEYGLMAGDPCCVTGETGVSGNISNARYSVFTGIAASGTTSTTATVLNYGVNVIETADISNVAIKLPQPVTGKSVKIVNLTTVSIYVYPSNIGGKINNLPVDTPQLIPADGKAYEFICTENPFPGNWNVLNSPSTGSFFYQISVSHVHGTATYVVVDDSTGNTISGTTAYMSNNGNNTFSLAPSSAAWKTFNTPTTSTYLKVYTNIVPSDVAGGTGNEIQVGRTVCYMYNPTPPSTYGVQTTSGQLMTFENSVPGSNPYLTQVTTGPVSGGTISIGDVNTLYCEMPQVFHFSSVGGAVLDQLGPIPTAPNLKSNMYSIYKVYIPGSAATKTYQFYIVQEYM